MKRALLALLAACATAHPAATAKGKPVLLIRCPVPDATVYIDDQLVGDVADLSGGVRIPAGYHRVEIRDDRYHTRYAEVTLAPGDRKVLEMPLAEALP